MSPVRNHGCFIGFAMHKFYCIRYGTDKQIDECRRNKNYTSAELCKRLSTWNGYNNKKMHKTREECVRSTRHLQYILNSKFKKKLSTRIEWSAASCLSNQIANTLKKKRVTARGWNRQREQKASGRDRLVNRLYCNVLDCKITIHFNM